jgi:hypothetical protein
LLRRQCRSWATLGGVIVFVSAKLPEAVRTIPKPQRSIGKNVMHGKNDFRHFANAKIYEGNYEPKPLDADVMAKLPDAPNDPRLV